MKVLVTYVSETGNTRKVAEAIHSALTVEKELRPLAEVDEIGGYDLVFVGFPIVSYGPPSAVSAFLGEKCAGKRIALFATHAAPDDAGVVSAWIAPAREAAAEAEILGLFHCQGELAAPVKAHMLASGDARLEAWARADDSQGQPDAARLERARAFAAEVLARLQA